MYVTCVNVNILLHFFQIQLWIVYKKGNFARFLLLFRDNFIEDWRDIHKHLRVVTNVSHFPTFPQALPLFMSLACRRLGGWRKYTIFQQLSGKRSTRAGRKLTPMEYFTNNLGYLNTTITLAPEINTSLLSPHWLWNIHMYLGNNKIFILLPIKVFGSPQSRNQELSFYSGAPAWGLFSFNWKGTLLK